MSKSIGSRADSLAETIEQGRQLVGAQGFDLAAL